MPAEAESEDPLGAEKHDSDPDKTKMDDNEVQDRANGEDFDNKKYIEELNKKLLEAAEAGEEDNVRTLLSEVGNSHYKNEYDNTAGHFAAMEGHNGVLKLLLEKGFNINIQGVCNFTPLIWAAREGHHSTVKMLGDMGADLNLQTSNGMTALMWAANWGHLETVASCCCWELILRCWMRMTGLHTSWLEVMLQQLFKVGRNPKLEKRT